MNNSKQPVKINQANFIEILSAEFISARGYGAYAFLTSYDIESLYQNFRNDTVSPTVFVRIFVNHFS